MVEAQVDSVCEITERGIATVTGDAGYAYAGVYGGLERRGIDAVIPVRRDPPRSRVPLRRFRYDARNDVVKCPRGKTLRPAREIGRGRFFPFEDPRLRALSAAEGVSAALGHEEAGCDSA